ncbi:hypothetical protein B0H12DRAFT_1068737 [Mycena haematopus]|nr:hypothetical protein B0H12DRAFT_1068737 [Mycena haematopus]
MLFKLPEVAQRDLNKPLPVDAEDQAIHGARRDAIFAGSGVLSGYYFNQAFVAANMMEVQKEKERLKSLGIHESADSAPRETPLPMVTSTAVHRIRMSRQGLTTRAREGQLSVYIVFDAASADALAQPLAYRTRPRRHGNLHVTAIPIPRKLCVFEAQGNSRCGVIINQHPHDYSRARLFVMPREWD